MENFHEFILACMLYCNKTLTNLPSHSARLLLWPNLNPTLSWYNCQIFHGRLQCNSLLIMLSLCHLPSHLIYLAPPSHYPGLLIMDSNLGCQTRVSSCSHYCSKLHTNLSSTWHAPNNNVQKQARNYLLFDAYWRSAQVEVIESSEAKNTAGEAVQWYSTGVFGGGCFLARNC